MGSFLKNPPGTPSYRLLNTLQNNLSSFKKFPEFLLGAENPPS